jgi:hypothetical protein
MSFWSRKRCDLAQNAQLKLQRAVSSIFTDFGQGGVAVLYSFGILVIASIRSVMQVMFSFSHKLTKDGYIAFNNTSQDEVMLAKFERSPNRWIIIMIV